VPLGLSFDNLRVPPLWEGRRNLSPSAWADSASGFAGSMRGQMILMLCSERDMIFLVSAVGHLMTTRRVLGL
jgi:hypothetical protein